MLVKERLWLGQGSKAPERISKWKIQRPLLLGRVCNAWCSIVFLRFLSKKTKKLSFFLLFWKIKVTFGTAIFFLLRKKLLRNNMKNVKVVHFAVEIMVILLWVVNASFAAPATPISSTRARTAAFCSSVYFAMMILLPHNIPNLW